jgi:hypothetical protein
VVAHSRRTGQVTRPDHLSFAGDDRDRRVPVTGGKFGASRSAAVREFDVGVGLGYGFGRWFGQWFGPNDRRHHAGGIADAEAEFGEIEAGEHTFEVVGCAANRRAL